MIARLSGTCAHVDEESLVVDVGGVGYVVRPTTGVLQRARVGEQCVVHVHTHVRDDALQLFGFGSYGEQLVFERLLSLQGVGPKVALSIVSAFPPGDIRRAAEHDDVALFQSVPGIGPKVARRIVTELQDKLDGLPLGTTTYRASVTETTFYDARDALVELGLSVPVAESALRETDEGASTDERVRQALKAVRA